MNKFNISLFLTILSLIVMGLISIYSSTNQTTMHGNFNKQMISVLIGIVLMFGFTFTSDRLIKFVAYPLYVISILLLIYVLFFGKEIYGTKGWITFGSFNLQPAEIAKLAALLCISKFLSGKGRDILSLRDLFFSFFLIAIPFYLIAKQPDFGSATVLISLFFGFLFWGGFDKFILFSLISIPLVILMALRGNLEFYILLAVISIALFFFRKNIIYTLIVILILFLSGISANLVFEKLAPHQKKRIEVFMNPEADPLGSGYNVIQSKTAVGSGGLFGKGFLKGSQTQLSFVPMQWTDFIFSVPAEEFGLLGVALILYLYLNLLLNILDISYENENKFLSYVTAGAFFIFLYHILINIGMVIGLMPVMGIPLPFMSYGGTAMIFNLSMVGIIFNAHRNKKSR